MGSSYINTCFELNTKLTKWKKLEKMKEEKINAHSTVFEGKIVVTGRKNDDVTLNTVEAYDHVVNTWSRMPNMIKERYGHKSVAVKNKLFAICGFN